MTDIIAMHRADLVDAVTAAVTPIKAERDAIAAARQHEFAYIEKVLKACSNATASDMRDELRDLRAWATNRSTCFSVETKGEQAMTDEQIKHMVNRFLGWRLPEHFRPDAGISFNPEYNVGFNAARGKPPACHQPSGTNLFDATQTEAMVRYMIEGMPR